MIPTEPIGSIPRSAELLSAMRAHAEGRIGGDALRTAQDAALRDTISRFEQTGSPIISDGEQTKSSFATYPLLGLKNLASDGVVIPFADGHTRQLPRLTAGPCRFGIYAGTYLKTARQYTRLPVKQAVISVSVLSLLYPAEAIPGYSRKAFLEDLLREGEADIRSCLEAGAACVQIDFTEGRLAVKLDPSGGLLDSFVSLINRVLERFTSDERKRMESILVPEATTIPRTAPTSTTLLCCPRFFNWTQVASTCSWRVSRTVAASWQRSSTFSRQGSCCLLESPTPSIRALKLRRKFGTVFLRLRRSCLTTLLAQPMIADFPRSQTSHPLREKLRFRRSAAGWRARGWLRKFLECSVY